MVTRESQAKTAIITASYSGIGSELSKLLVQEGYRLVVLNRDSARTQRQIEELKALSPGSSIEHVAVDLADHASIRYAANQLVERYPRVDLLFNNAGLLSNALQFSPQGNELHYEVNVVAPYLLTTLLRPALAAAERPVAVVVGSSAMKMVRKLDIPTLQKPRKFKKFAPYAASKLAVATAFLGMADDFAGDGILLRIVDPGMNKTPMSRNDGIPALFKMLRVFFATPDVGARRVFDAALNRQFGNQGGIYIEKGRIARSSPVALRADVQQAVLKVLGSTVGG